MNRGGVGIGDFEQRQIDAYNREAMFRRQGHDTVWVGRKLMARDPDGTLYDPEKRRFFAGTAPQVKNTEHDVVFTGNTFHAPARDVDPSLDAPITRADFVELKNTIETLRQDMLRLSAEIREMKTQSL
jgi:hypothetical protein